MTKRAYYYKILRNCLLTTLIAIASISTLAQEEAGVTYGARLFFGHDSNVLRQTNEISDTTLNVDPRFKLLRIFGKHSFTLNYNGNYKKYFDVSYLDYNAHDFKLETNLDHTQRLSSNFIVQYQKKIEEPGINDQSTIALQEFNALDFVRIKGLGAYGRRDSIGQIVLELNHNQFRYNNNQQEFRDINISGISAKFYYRIAPKTRILVETSFNDIEYIKTEQFDPSSKDTRYFVGVDWEITAKTSGTFKTGYQTKSYGDSMAFSNISGLSYSLDMTWLPNTFTKVTVGAARTISESANLGVGGFIDNSFNTHIEHAFTERTKLKAAYSYGEYDITSLLVRPDKRHEFGIGFSHDLKRWIEIELLYRFQERTSDDELFEFDAQIIELGVTLDFE